MKKIWICILSIAVLSACDDMAKNTAQSGKLSTDLVKQAKTASAAGETTGSPAFAFEKDIHDFGSMIAGEKVSYSFQFTNTGDAPLIISNAKGSCGCTVPNWPKQPIAAGEKGTIDVTFNSAGRSGKQTKTITLTANTNPNKKQIKITSEVISE